VQVLLNFWVYVVIAVLLFAQWFECDPVKYKAVDVTQTVVIAIFFAGLALMFARYGLRLLLLLRQMQHPVRARLAANIATICALCASLFLLRGVLFLLEPLFHYRITGWWQDALFPWAFYPLPELVPGIVMLHLMAPRPRQVRVRQDDQRPLLASAAADAASAPGRAADADAAAGVAGFGSFTAKPQGRDTFWV
jgi:hypothetical protein